MNVLLLGNPNTKIAQFLQEQEDVVIIQDKIDDTFLNENDFEFIVSYNYPYIIGEDIIKYYAKSIINLHISFLPWNRGADPNFWSFMDNTPKGVTIHYISKGLDKGEILLQKELKFSEEETFSSTYFKLQLEIQELFKDNWKKIKLRLIQAIQQEDIGSYHRRKDKDTYMKYLTNGWDTKIIDFKKNLLEGNYQ